VVAYGQILSAEILNLPRLGCINIHASLLPRWRGAAPIQRAIEAGDRISGITLMRMDKGLDTGDVLRQIETPIYDTDSTATLGARLADLGADALAQLLVAPEADFRQATPQNPLQASYATKLTKEESWLDWTQPAVTLERQIRAYFPTPLARSILLEQLVIIHSATLGSNTLNTAPGTIIGLSQEGIQVQAIDGTINLSTLQLAGRKPVSAKSFVNGFSVRPGQRFAAPKTVYAKR
jgi:methionyl-tRNA formyltransferase